VAGVSVTSYDKEHVMTEYVILLTGDPDRWWNAMTEEEVAAGLREHERFSSELVKRGHEIVGGAELHHPRDAKRIPAGGGAVTDGPFAELTEQVGGFYQVRTDNLDDLVDCCQIIAGTGDTITVVPVVTAEEREG
jgi:hypothetical protein